MIEAVSTVIQSAPVTQALSKQVAASTSVAAETSPTLDRTGTSFNIKVDNNYDRGVLEIVAESTGDVLEQIPSDTRLEAQRREQARAEAQSQELKAALSSSSTPTSVRALEAEESGSVSTQDASSSVPVVRAPNAPTEPINAAAVQQVAAFENAAQSGNTNAGNVSLFA